jgi:hypothetical protein
MGNFQIFMFLENLIELSCFIDDKNYRVIKRHRYGVGEKNICSIQTWDERKKMIKNTHSFGIYTIKKR